MTNSGLQKYEQNKSIDHSIPAIILAAGKSERYGAPKVLQNFLGKPFLSRIADALYDAGIAQIYLVLGYRAAQVQTQLPSIDGLQIVVNENYKSGQISSLQAGICALPPQCTGTLLCLIDQPHLFASTYVKLLAVAHAAPAMIAVPVYDCHRGHPLYLPAWFGAEILRTPTTDSLRTVLAHYAEQIITVTVADPGITVDIDTPADLHRLEELFPLNRK